MEHENGRDQLICMVGTDHSLASAEVRSAFSLPEEVRAAELSRIKESLEATGIVMLATCNRTELWASFDKSDAPLRSIDENDTLRPDDAVFAAFCAAHHVDPARYAPHFICRSGDKAVEHLFHVSCGLRSAIIAEDQIVSQVKRAIAFSRKHDVADSVLEVLFRQAVTAAKQVKSGVRFTRAYATAVEQVVERLTRQGLDLSQATCMVVGNGEYGRLASSALVERGARVYVTVRQYTHGSVVIPQGCEGIPYGDRYEYLDRCNVVMSATTSPHYTLTRHELEASCPDHEAILVDLAIPCDIEPGIAALPSYELWNIDDFATEIGVENNQAIVAARKLLDAGMGEFWDWVHRRDTTALTKPPVSAFFPVFVDWSEKRAAFIGGGTVALRRIRTLLPFVGDIVVFAPDFSPDIERFARDGAITLQRASYAPSMLEGFDIVFACTNDTAVNDDIWAECKRRGLLVNVCSDRSKCDFQFPGIVQRDNVVVGVNAGGKDHRRVKQLRARIDRLMDEEDL